MVALLDGDQQLAAGLAFEDRLLAADLGVDVDAVDVEAGALAESLVSRFWTLVDAACLLVDALA